MERCHLNPIIPQPNSTTFDAQVEIDPTGEIDIWMPVLDSLLELLRHILWSQAPPRRSHFATIDLTGHGHKPVVFYCPSTSFSTFEFSCSKRTPHCHVEFWQRTKADPIPARNKLNGKHLKNKWSKMVDDHDVGVYMAQYDPSGTRRPWTSLHMWTKMSWWFLVSRSQTDVLRNDSRLVILDDSYFSDIRFQSIKRWPLQGTGYHPQDIPHAMDKTVVSAPGVQYFQCRLHLE